MTMETASNSANGSSSKVTPQLKHRKPPRRKMSPINWFPRKKVDSYLNRKIKMLQEVDGMKLTLDQTLGDSNPHYCLVLREKMAAREAADKAMEARRAALVEASWCRILRAARISSDDAEAQLSKAEKNAEEAFEAAQSVGVIMYDLPNCGPGKNKHCQIESSSVNGEGSSTHTVTASFETAFDVDKEVAAAVKAAFVRLSNCHSFNKDEFRELLRKISENPDAEDDKNRDLYELSSEYESESGSELEKGDFTPQHLDSNMPLPLKTSNRKGRRRQSLDKFNRFNLVDMMLERLKCLQEDELSSLATIVATCGLNAALAQVHNSKLHNSSSATDTDHTSSSTINFPARRMSLLAMGKKQVGSELPSLDKFLVKRMTKLEREVQEAKNKRRSETESDKDRSRKSFYRTPSETINEVPGLDKFLVKHVSRLEKEVQEAKNRTINEGKRVKMIGPSIGLNSDEALEGKENINITSEESNMNDVIEENKDGLDKILIKPVHRLEKEKMQASSLEGNGGQYKQSRNQLATGVTDCESLDKILVKHVSRLEKEKMRFKSTREEDKIQVKRDHRNNMHSNAPNVNVEGGGGGLEQILVKHEPRLAREKMVADQAQKQNEEENPISVSMARRAAREKELQQTWGGLSLGTSIKPRLSKLERDKAAWIKAEEEERRQAMKAISE